MSRPGSTAPDQPDQDRSEAPSPTPTRPRRRTGRIGRAWQAWTSLLGCREPALGLACFRIAVGLVMLYSLLSVGLHGLIELLWLDVGHGGYKPLGSTTWLLAQLGGPRPDVIYPLYGTALALALAHTLGLGGPVLGRAISFAALHVYMALVFINGEATGGYDSLISNALWLCVLGNATATLSWASRYRTGSWLSGYAILAWPRYLAIFQLVVVYTATGLHKLSAEWTPAGGHMALFRVFQDPTWRRFDMDFTAWVVPLTQIATAVTWLFELSAPLLLLVYYYRGTRDRRGRLRALMNRRDLRIPFAGLGLCLHLGILITLDVGPFSWITLAYYLCLWHPDELACVARRIRLRALARQNDQSQVGPKLE